MEGPEERKGGKKKKIRQNHLMREQKNFGFQLAGGRRQNLLKGCVQGKEKGRAKEER